MRHYSSYQKIKRRLPRLQPVPPFWLTLSIAVVAISVLWPRYAYLAMGPLPNMTASFVVGAIVGGLICVALVIDASFRSRFFETIGTRPSLFFMLLIWYLWRLICDIVGKNPPSNFYYTFQDMINLAYMFVIGAVIASDPKGRLWVFRNFTVLTVIVGLIGLFESMTRHPILATLGINLSGVNNSELSLLMTPNLRDGVYRVSSVFVHPIVLAQFMAAMAPIVLHVLQSDSTKVFRLFALSALPLIPFSIYVSGSRSGYLGLAVSVIGSLGLMSIRRMKQGATGLIVVGALISPVLLVGVAAGWDSLEQLFKGKTNEEVSSTVARTMQFSRGSLALERSPIFGYGDGMAAIEAGMPQSNGRMTIDNYYISTAVDFGVPGLLLLFSLAGVVLWRGYKLSVSPNLNAEDAGAAQAITASGVSILVIQWILSDTDNMSLYYFYIALLGGLSITQGNTAGTVPMLRARKNRFGMESPQ
jgi:O-Antigen ligase